MFPAALKPLASLAICLSCLALPADRTAAYELHDGPTGVLKNVAGKTFEGYTLFAPTVKCTTTYLINMQGDVVHTWESKYPPGLYARLLPNGNLLRAGSLSGQPVKIGGAGGIIEEIDWNGKVVWSYTMKSDTEIQHHCYRQGAAQRLPNGNTLVTSTQQGHLFEVTPAGEVVWEFVNPIMKGQPKAFFCDATESLPGKSATNMIHRAYRYAPDYPGLRGRDLSATRPLVPGWPRFLDVYKPLNMK